MSDLPERINVMKVVTYEVADIVDLIKSERDATDTQEVEVTIGDVMERVEGWVKDDFGAEHTRFLIYQDENGDEIDN